MLAVGVWWLQALVMPLEAGRDFGTYLGAYAQLFHSHPIDLGYLLGRTPLAPLIAGALLDFGGGVLAEPVMSLLYATSILAWFLTARTFSRRAALLVAAVLLAYPGYGILFHELSSDSVFAAAFALWSLLVVRVLRAPTPLRFAYVGAGLGVLVLIRPGNQVLLVLVLRAALARCDLGARGSCPPPPFVVAALVLIGGWALHNGLRYDDYVVARGGNQTVPFYRAFVTDRIVRPENGSASRELANAVRTRLLPQEPYRSYGITLQRFFRGRKPADAGGSRRAVRSRQGLEHESALVAGRRRRSGPDPQVGLHTRRRPLHLGNASSGALPLAALRAYRDACERQAAGDERLPADAERG